MIDLTNESCFDLLPRIEKNSVDLVLIDPPYEVSRDTNFQSGEATGRDTDRFRVSIDFGEWCDGFYVVKSAPKLHNEKYTDEELNLAEKFYYNMETWKNNCRKEKERRLITEEGHKIPYAELLEKYEASEKEKKALAALCDNQDKTMKFFAETMEQDRHIIRAYQLKMKELNPDFDFVEFENKILEEYQ